MLGTLAIAAVSGLYTSTWGAFKDGPYEGFRADTFVRSVVFSVAIAVGLLAVPGLGAERMSPFQLFFLIMGVERLATEIYKGCFRAERDPERFAIPQPLTFFGRRIGRGWLRGAVGLLGCAAMALVLGLETEIVGLPGFVAAGFGAGLFVSLGGAYKDAPFEGFQPFKFFRSSLVLTALAPLVWRLGPMPLGLLLFTFGGVERLVVEYYKSYVVRSVPGKFRADLPIIPGPYLHHRHLLRHVATTIVALVGLLYVAGGG